MKGIKNYNKKVRALHDIHGICIKGNTYELIDLKRLFPYIDFNNSEYWEEVFDYKFNVGDNVRFIGHINNITKKGISKIVTYKITKITPQIYNEMLYIYYDIKDSVGETFTVTQAEIESVPERWIISFGQNIHTDYPGIHYLDFNAWETKIKGTWKEKFVFGNYDEAVTVAKIFSRYSLPELVNLDKHEKTRMEKINKFKEWLYDQDWSGSPEEQHAHNCVINKFEELGLDEAF